ncbi:hypothetical protein GCM10027074_36940 [Streptomyces deserti]
MIDSGSPERIREFSPAQYIAPYLLLVIANAGVRKVSADDRPVLLWVFAAITALGVASTVVRLRRMWNTHQRHPLPGWTRFLGALLALYGLYVVYCLFDGTVS